MRLVGCLPLWRTLPGGPRSRRGHGDTAYPGTSVQGKGCGKVRMGIGPASLKMEWVEEGQLQAERLPQD